MMKEVTVRVGVGISYGGMEAYKNEVGRKTTGMVKVS